MSKKTYIKTSNGTPYTYDHQTGNVSKPDWMPFSNSSVGNAGSVSDAKELAEADAGHSVTRMSTKN